MSTRVRVPATCGELVQGSLDGVPCLVSCPIDLWACAEVALSADSRWHVPADAPKTAQAIAAGLGHWGREQQGGRVCLTSPIPRARGYGSSTADISAALYALAGALGQELPAAQAARLAVSVEPSDGTMFSGLALLDHRRASFHEILGPAPALTVIVLDPGGEVDTVAFNKLDLREHLERTAAQHRVAFGLLRHGIQRNDLDALGEAATLSARLHQAILHHPLLDQAIAIARAVGAAGVCRAHSGTILGILLDPRRCDVPDVLERVRRDVRAGVAVKAFDVCDGGPIYHQTDRRTQ